MGYYPTEWHPSELGGGEPFQDCHHIENRKAGGTTRVYRIEDLIGISRIQHDKIKDGKQHKAMMYRVHKAFLIANGIAFDEKYIDEKIEKWKPYELENV
jgi:hypothetical protein